MSVYASSRFKWIDRHFHALTHRHFRTIWLGQCVSLVGTWAQTIAQSWLVLTLTDSPLLLGFVGVAQFLPFTCLSLFAGAVVDRYPKRTILLLTQSFSMLLALTLSLLVFTGTVSYLHIVVIALLTGVSNSFDLPARQAFNVEVVGAADLMNAVALNSSTLNLARIVGPAIGALLMATLGPGWCFLVNAVSFAGLLIGLARMKIASFVRPRRTDTGIVTEIGDGLRYLFRDRSLLTAALLVLLIGTFGFNYNVLIPVLTRDVLHMKENAYGLLMSCIGIGSLVGAIALSVASRKGPRLAVGIGCCLAVASFLVLVGIARTPAAVGIALVCTGFFNIVALTTGNAYLQVHASAEYRSRVMGVYSLVFVGSTPLGSLFAGYISDRFGAGYAFLLCGVCLFACGLLLRAFRADDARRQ
ncbi:MFS transporter [Paenibacillus cymbidii]|uniref:MFS transporter n=1 Tax=Paenibacillus cymbidii TaxID=1639034 RepID=UPI0010820A1E|nr:MFS transporter [Paenibacillus cymbidii]